MNNIINVKTITDNDGGSLSFFEAYKDIPFEIKRIYYTYDVAMNTKRGMHAHKTLKQILWCPYGSIQVILDNGKVKETYILDSPQKALLVLCGYWHDMVWIKAGSILCVAASDYYDESDYIRDYNQFKEHVERGYWKDEN